MKRRTPPTEHTLPETTATNRPRANYNVQQTNAKVGVLVGELEKVFGDVGLYKQLLRSRGKDAQSLLDTFQCLLDRPELRLRSNFRRSLIIATQRLSKKSHLYPACYELRGVVQESQDPVAAGGFADIYKGTFEGQAVCMKVVRIYRNTEIDHFLKQFSKEAILWGQLAHPNILPIYGLYRFRNSICLVSPWMEQGDITQYLRNSPDVSRLRLAVDVAEGLSYLHKNGIIHGDLKGPNILINDNGVACLADFGISSISDPDILAWTSHSSAASKGGSVRWQAPELFDMEGDRVVKNSVASDVYAWSCVCYEIFTDGVPFTHILRDTVLMLQIKAGIRPTRPEDLSPAWKQWGLTEKIWLLMEDCWKDAPDERPSIERVIEQLAPEWGRDEQPKQSKTLLSPSSFRQRMTGAFDVIAASALDCLSSLDVDVGSALPEEEFTRGTNGVVPPSPTLDLSPKDSRSLDGEDTRSLSDEPYSIDTLEYGPPDPLFLPDIFSPDTSPMAPIQVAQVASDAVLKASERRRVRHPKFICPVPNCEQAFTSKTNLSYHIDAQDGVRRHQCDFCSERFRTQGTLKRHQRSVKCPGSRFSSETGTVMDPPDSDATSMPLSMPPLYADGGQIQNRSFWGLMYAASSAVNVFFSQIVPSA